ncbi:MAG: dihydroorotate dehydrogenase [Bacteroidales bacterium]|nr:dihydroorotate dehydrogenase [Bacteroidales bacterium]
MIDLSVKLGNLELINPILTASGTFGYGFEFDDFININELGGFITKSVTLNKREGNPYPRIAETPSGMLNSIGLQNKGLKYFISEIYPILTKYKCKIFVNVAGSSLEEYIQVAEELNELSKVDGIELNVSCPNVKEGGIAFGINEAMLTQVVREVRKVYSKHLMVKLSPNVTDIKVFAKIAENEGADSISVINTLLGMMVDVKTKKPLLATITGGLSGPAILPIALRMVYECSKAVKIPIVGVGGISKAEDVIAFLLCGATAVQIGTINFVDPTASIKILNGILSYCELQNIERIRDLVGKLEK